jgi:LmbE family N-acetylglucosaminyl deacetylase
MTRRGYAEVADLAHALQPRLLRLWRRALVSVGRDVTEEVSRRRCLVIAPHPDDETLGCGATIARKRARGTEVTIVIAADGRYSHRSSTRITPEEMRAIRAEEAYRAARCLGVEPEHVHQLGFEDTALEQSFDDVVRWLRGVVADRTPDEILVVSGLDAHPDHRTLHRATSVALGVDPPCVVAEYPVWSWVSGPWLDLSSRAVPSKSWHLFADPVRTVGRGRPWLVATGPYREQKQRALSEYRSQTTRLSGEDDWAVMDDEFLSDFTLDHEVFLPYRPTTSQ